MTSPSESINLEWDPENKQTKQTPSVLIWGYEHFNNLNSNCGQTIYRWSIYILSSQTQVPSRECLALRLQSHDYDVKYIIS